MRVIVSGATGFIGKALCPRLLDLGHDVVALTRSAASVRGALPAAVTPVEWKPGELGAWTDAIEGANAVIHLAAEQKIRRRTTGKDLAEARASRVGMVEVIAQGISRARVRPPVFLVASAVSVYGNRGDDPLDETASLSDKSFAQLCVDTENAAFAARSSGARVVALRIGYVIGLGGGVLEPVVPLFRSFLGVRIGSKRQWIPWIHLDDTVGLILHALSQGDIDGPLNVTAPNPVQAGEFFSAVGRALDRPCWLALPPWLVKSLFGDGISFMLWSARALPARAEATGYSFAFPVLADALAALFRHSG